MRSISLLQPATPEAIKLFAETRGLSRYLPASYEHPQEDYLLAADKLPVYVVADGVTLNFKKFAEAQEAYPNPSPAGRVAQIFCEAVQASAASRSGCFVSEDAVKIFKEANQAVAAYNHQVGPSDRAGNPTNWYSATGAVMIVQDREAHWASICDSFFAQFDRGMQLKFKSSGRCRPYAVINGEEKMMGLIEYGSVTLSPGDRLFVFTDGFASHFEEPRFLALFRDWDETLLPRLQQLGYELNATNPEKYGHERSLIAVEI